jgi:hypothetical protein
MTIKRPIREPQLCPECGYLLHFRAESAGRLVPYCEGCEVEIPIGPVPETDSALSSRYSNTGRSSKPTHNKCSIIETD